VGARSSSPASPASPASPGSPGSADVGPLLIEVAGPTGAADRGTVVNGHDPTTRALVRTVRLTGRFELPRVVPSGPAEGVSHDGRIVVLEQPGGGTISRFAVLDGRLSEPARIVELPAGFSYDALSADGSDLYLIEHLGAAPSERYQVRVYALDAGRLEDWVIADKTRIGEWMAGHPTSRWTSGDGDVVATLYERDGGAPFVHVLHTDQGYAICVDLPYSAVGARLAGTASEVWVQGADGASRTPIEVQPG
jgi:hypothetical protein